jgi:hypothetical protein
MRQTDGNVDLACKISGLSIKVICLAQEAFTLQASIISVRGIPVKKDFSFLIRQSVLIVKGYGNHGICTSLIS